MIFISSISALEANKILSSRNTTCNGHLQEALYAICSIKLNNTNLLICLLLQVCKCFFHRGACKWSKRLMHTPRLSNSKDDNWLPKECVISTPPILPLLTTSPSEPSEVFLVDDKASAITVAIPLVRNGS